MNRELQDKIFAKYPVIFGDRTKPMTETCMCWGLEVGDGWYDLIDALCESLSATYSTSVRLNPDQVEQYGNRYQDYDPVLKKLAGPEVAHNIMSVNPPQVVADQVKEKFGTLRFYYHLVFDEKVIEVAKTNPAAADCITRYSSYYDGIVDHAETYSARTCEITGKPGTLGSAGGWWSVRSPEAAEAEGRGWKPAKTVRNTPEAAVINAVVHAGTEDTDATA